MGPMALPPGFRFHPTDDELVGYYLKRKVEGLTIELEVIPVIELYKFDPWELPEKSFLPKRDMEWFFFCPRDRKYPNGSRTNRATASGYWKATGKDRKVVCDSSVYGLRKTLVFYRGRAPGGERTEWVMYEYRLIEDFSEGSLNFVGAFALCHVVKRNEHGQKNSDLHGVPKAKRTHSYAMSDFGAMKDLSKGSSSSEENPSRVMDLLKRTNYSTPSENGMVIEFDPTVTDTDQASFWIPNVLSDATKAFQREEGNSSESLVPVELSNSASANTTYGLSPVSSYSDLRVEDYLANNLSGDGCLSSFPSPLHCMGVYNNDQYMELQGLEWNPPRFMNPPTSSNEIMESWNTMMPTICRQSSEGEEASLWFQEDNYAIVF